MALVPIKTASTTGYCDCICGCYELASLRDEETGKGYCPRCGKEHLDLNRGVGLMTHVTVPHIDPPHQPRRPEPSEGSLLPFPRFYFFRVSQVPLWKDANRRHSVSSQFLIIRIRRGHHQLLGGRAQHRPLSIIRSVRNRAHLHVQRHRILLFVQIRIHIH